MFQKYLVVFIKITNTKKLLKGRGNKASKKDRELVKQLPNFDAEIFKDISGIDVNENSHKDSLLKKAQELIDKAEELKREASNL